MSFARRLGALAGALGLGALVWFHATLLYSHVVGGQLADPAIAVRWTLSALVVGLLVAFRRLGIPLVRGRRAMAVWLLVVLMHVSAARPAVLQAFTGVSPDDAAVALFLVPTTVAAALTGVLLLVAGSFRPSRRVALSARRWPGPVAATVLADRLVVPLLPARAPPAILA